ncbi:Outer membrane protein (OmpH-like) [compost metagenome]
MKKGVLLGIVMLLLLIVGGLVGFFIKGSDSVRFVSMNKLYLESSYYQKFQKDLKELETKSNNQLANIQKDIRDYKASGAETSFIKELEDELVVKQEELTAEYQEKSKKLDEIIWGEINRVLTEYGKKKGIDFVLGAKGDGNIMFASDRCDITEDVLEYMKTHK